MAKSSRLWDYLGAITKTKDLSVLKDANFAKIYTPFVINMALSQHEDCVLAAQMMNERPDIPKENQFRFLLNTLRARYRRSDWLKNTVSDDVKAVAEYYECNLRRAHELLSLHTSAQLTTIRARLDKGGIVKKVRAHGSATS